MPPEFTKKEWQVEVDETEGDNIPETPILVVSVNDGDLLETNRFSYKVIDNAFGADKFTMVTNSDGTGSLKIAKVSVLAVFFIKCMHLEINLIMIS